MLAWIPENILREALGGWHITRSAVLSKDIVYLVARQTISAKIEPTHWADHDILARFIRIDLSKNPEEAMTWQDFDGFKHAMLGIAQKPSPVGVLLADNFAGCTWSWGEEVNGPIQQIDSPNAVPSPARLRCIGEHLYSAGRWHVYKRTDDSQWIKLSNGLLKDEDAEHDAEYWFSDIDGFGENDIYASAYRDKQAVELLHFDGNQWSALNFPGKEKLTALCCAGDGFVYISDNNRNLWRGRDCDWQLIYKNESYSFGWNCMIWFEEKLWCASVNELFVFDGRGYEKITLDGEVDLFAFGGLNIDARGGLLILSNDEKALTYQQGKWQLLVEISNEDDEKKEQEIAKENNKNLRKKWSASDLIKASQKDRKKLDCTCFSLPYFEYINVLQASPALLRAHFKFNIPNRIALCVEEKGEEEKEYKDFKEFFHQNDLHPVKTHKTEKYEVLFYSKLDADGFEFFSVIELDDSHCLSFYYTDENGREEYIKDTEHLLLHMLDHLQLSGNHEQALQALHEQEENAQDPQMLQYRQQYKNREEQAADPFHVRQNPQLFAKLQQALQKRPQLKEWQDGIISNARLALGFIETEEDDYSEKGNTRFGGLPDLPPDSKYPKVDSLWAMANQGKGRRFIAQLNCAELHEFQPYLPKKGMLYFFIDSLHQEEYISDSCHVFYYSGDSKDLKSAKELEIEPRHIYDSYESSKEIKPSLVKVLPHVSIDNPYPDGGDLIYPPANCPSEEDYEGSIFADIDQLNGVLIEHKEKALHSINSNIPLVSQNAHIEAAKELGGIPQDYVLLLCLSNQSSISGFNNSDPLLFMIHREDLRNQDFSRVYCNKVEADYAGMYEE